MRTVQLCLCLALLLPCGVRGQRSSPSFPKDNKDTRMGAMAVDRAKGSSALNSLLRPSHHHPARAPRLVVQVPKRAQPGSRFALSLDVPTSILSVLIDLAKNQDMKTRAAANAELLARIGKRK